MPVSTTMGSTSERWDVLMSTSSNATAALIDGQPLFEVMDCLSSTTMDCFESLFEVEGEDWKPVVTAIRNENRGYLPNVMLINRVRLDPEARGHGIGMEAVLKVMERLGTSCEVITCKPFPLQFDGIARDHPEEFKAAQDKVRKFLSNVGFKRVSATEYYLWPD